MSITAPTLHLYPSAGITSGGPISIQSNYNNASTPDALVVTMDASSSTTNSYITTTGALTFNQTTAGQIAVGPTNTSTTGTGNLSGGSIGVNGGSYTTLINVNSENCCITGLGNSYLGGSSVTFQVASGTLQVGPLTSPAITLTNLDSNSGATHGVISLCGNVSATGTLIVSAGSGNNGSSVNALSISGYTLSGGTVTVNTPKILWFNRPHIELDRHLDIQGYSASSYQVAVSLDSTSSITATSALKFNPSNAGQISVGSGVGAISGSSVGLNGGSGTANHKCKLNRRYGYRSGSI